MTQRTGVVIIGCMRTVEEISEASGGYALEYDGAIYILIIRMDRPGQGDSPVSCRPSHESAYLPWTIGSDSVVTGILALTRWLATRARINTMLGRLLTGLVLVLIP